MKIYKIIYPLAVLLLITLLFTAMVNEGPEASSIVKKADDKRMGNTSISEMKLTVIRPSWTREMELKVWTKGKEKLMILISEPARDKGTTFLKRDKEIWNWIPRIERVVKLPPSAMMQAWMGSDFSNDDLVKQSSMTEDYNHELLGEVQVNERQAYKIKMLPKEEASVVWGMVMAFIDKEEMVFLKQEYYDEDDELVNTLLGKQIKEMGGRTITSVIEIFPADKPEHKTILEYESIEFDQPIEDIFFSIQNLKSLR